MTIPDEFIAWQRARHGDAFANDLSHDLPRRIDAACLRWDLNLKESAPAFGDNALVFYVERAGVPLALKLTAMRTGLEDEIAALQMWDGQGMVRLHDAGLDLGALLLEPLGPRTLDDLPLDEALPISGWLLRRLCLDPATALPSLAVPTTGDIAAGVTTSFASRNADFGSPLTAADTHAIERLSHTLHEPRSDVVVHADLHGGNILEGTREPWIAIDPRPRRGDPEIAVAELLWTRVDDVPDASGIRWLLAEIVAHAHLDPERARAWAIVRAADYLLWGLEHGLTEDPPRCRRIIEALL